MDADMSLMRGVTNLAVVGSKAEDSRVTTDLGQNPSAAPEMGKVVMRNLSAQVTQLIAGCRAPQRGIEAPRDRTPGRTGTTRVLSVGIESPVSETLTRSIRRGNICVFTVFTIIWTSRQDAWTSELRNERVALLIFQR